MFICHVFINLSHVMVMVLRILGTRSDDDLDWQCVDQQTIAGDEHPEKDNSTEKKKWSFLLAKAKIFLHLVLTLYFDMKSYYWD